MKQISAMITRKLGSMSIRAAAKEIGISPTTFCNAKSGGTIDLATLEKICAWAGENANDYFTGIPVKIKSKPMKRSDISLPDAILRANKRFIAEVDAEFH